MYPAVALEHDGTTHVFDARAPAAPLAVLAPAAPAGGATATAFVPGTRLVATGYSDGRAVLWDAAHGGAVALAAHRDRVTALGVTGRGAAAALCTASWDQTLALWALPA
jgi:WD40 repeat protein